MSKEKIHMLTFLEDVLLSLGLTEIDNFIVDLKLATKEKDEDGDEVITSTPLISPSGYPFVMPRPEILKELFKENEFKQPELQYLPFNCVGEDLITGKSEAGSTMVRYIQSNVNTFLFNAGLALINMLHDDSALNGKSVGSSIQEFIEKVSKVAKGKTKNFADTQTVNLWKKIFEKVTKEPELYSFVNVKTGGIIGETKYARVASMNFPLHEALEDIDEEEMKYLGIKVRPKDVQVLKLVLGYLVEVNADYCVVVGSNHNNFPHFDAAYRLYLHVMKNIYTVKTKLEPLLDPTCPLATIELRIKDKDLEKSLSDIKDEVLLIPEEKDLLSNVETKEEPISVVNNDLPRTTKETKTVVNYSPRVQSQAVQPVQHVQPQIQNDAPVVYTESSADSNTLNRIFGGGFGGYGYGSNVSRGVYVNTNGANGSAFANANQAFLANTPNNYYGGYNSSFYTNNDGMGWNNDSNLTYAQRMSMNTGYSSGINSAYDYFMRS